MRLSRQWIVVPNVKQSILTAQFAQTTKNKAGEKSAPQKQQFRKRFKDAAVAAADATSSSQLTQREGLLGALFNVTNKACPSKDNNTLEQRAMISKTWSRLQMMRQHMQSSWERGFLRSKMRALSELKTVSAVLAKEARIIDYTIPPAHRRIPTETPPDPTKFPFVMRRMSSSSSDIAPENL